jgi:predicted Zn-dependent peptidase
LALASAQVTLGNGMRVFLLEDHELPLVRGSLLMRGGQRARC